MNKVTNEAVIDDGSELYTIKNKNGEIICQFSFNPTDTGILDRYKEVSKDISDYDLVKKSDEIGMEKAIVELDNYIREKFNILFNKDVSSGIFGVYAPCTVIANGDFFAEAVMEQMQKFIENAFNVRLENKKAKIKKATAKYRK